MPIHIIPTRISTTGKTLNSIIPINPTSAAYQMIKLTAAAKVPSAIAQTMRIYHSDAYAKELKLETVLSSAYLASSQNATALAAATFRESTPCDIGIFTV